MEEKDLGCFILEAYEGKKKCAVMDITDLSPEQFLDLLDIQEMLGRTCELKREER